MIAIVLRVDAGPYHARAVCSLSSRDRADARAACARGWLRLLPARGMFARRYVVTAAGSHAIGTFTMDRDDMPRRARMRGAA